MSCQHRLDGRAEVRRAASQVVERAPAAVIQRRGRSLEPVSYLQDGSLGHLSNIGFAPA